MLKHYHERMAGAPLCFFLQIGRPPPTIPRLQVYRKAVMLRGMEDMMGRRIEFTRDEVLEVRRLLGNGESYRTVARLMGMSLGMVQRISRLSSVRMEDEE